LHEACRAPDIVWIGDTDDQHTVELQNAVELLERQGGSFQMLKRLLQRDAIDARVVKRELVHAHRAKMLPHVRIEQLGCANVLRRIVNAEHGLIREPEGGLMHKGAGIAAHVDDRVSFDQREHL
jgi:hypothetical protein